MGKAKGGGGDNRKAEEARQKAEAAARQAAQENERRRQQDEGRRRQEEEGRRRQEEDNRRRQQEDEGRRRQETERQAQAAKDKAQAAQQSIKAGAAQVGNTLNRSDIRDLRQDGYSTKQIQKVADRVGQVGAGAQQRLDAMGGNRPGNGDGGGGTGERPSVRDAVAQVGNTLNRSDVRDLRQDGYSIKQIEKVGDRVDKVGAGAQQILDRVASAGGGSGSGGGTGGGRRPTGGRTRPAGGGDGLSGGTQPAPTPAPQPAAETGSTPNLGTADRTGWLAAELKAIGKAHQAPDITPRLFNNYRPTDLSVQLRDAVSEANNFIDQSMERWSGSSQARVAPTAVMPQSLLDEEQRRKYGLGF